MRKIAADGPVTTIAGAAGVPQPALHFDNVLPGLATDRSGNLFVAIGCAVERVGP